MNVVAILKYNKLIICLSLLFGLMLYALYPKKINTQCKMPETISGKVGLAESCSIVIFSSNKSGRYRPFLLNLINREVSQINLSQDLEDVFVRSLSSDCSKFAFISDTKGNNQFQPYIHDLNNNKTTKLSESSVPDFGNPIFSPDSRLLAYASQNQLTVLDATSNDVRAKIATRKSINTIVFSEDSEKIYLIDDSLAISMFDIASVHLSRIAMLPTKMPPPYGLAAYGEKLLVIADVQGEYAQIQTLDIETGTSAIVAPEALDQTAPQSAGESIWFKSIREGKFCLNSDSDTEFVSQVPCDGVIYDYLVNKSQLYFVYANYNSPISLYSLRKGGAAEELLGIVAPQQLPTVEKIASRGEMPHFLFKSTYPKTDSLVILLHGGPHQNISPRYDPYIANIQAAGISVLALNYLGSSGAGNTYEMRAVPKQQLLEQQIVDVLGSIDSFLSNNREYKKIHLLAMSYGANIAHSIVSMRPELFDSVIDFSGQNMLSAAAVEKLNINPEVKTLFIFGSEDYFYTNGSRSLLFDRFKTQNANSETVIIENEGHAIRSLEGMQKTCDSILDFLVR